MSGLILIPNNNSTQSNISLSSGTANAQFPLNNLKNVSPSIKFRSTTSSVVIVFDMLSTQPIDFIGIVGDPSNPLGFNSASIKTSITNDFSLSTPITIDIFNEQTMAYKLFNEVSHRYIELTINGSSYVEVGTVIIGKSEEFLQQNISLDSFRYEYTDLSKKQVNRYGQVFIDSLPLIKSIGGEIKFANLSEMDLIDNILIYLGKKKPVFMIVDKEGSGMIDGESKLSIYGYITSNHSWTADGGLHYSVNLEVEQAT